VPPHSPAAGIRVFRDQVMMKFREFLHTVVGLATIPVPPVTLLACGALLEVTPGGVMAPILRGEGLQAPTCWGRSGSPRAGPAPLIQFGSCVGLGAPGV
jgi:hypothetical protein